MDAKAFLQHYVMQSIPRHKNNEKGGSPLDLEGSHKCNGSSWELNLWGRPNLVCKAMSKMIVEEEMIVEFIYNVLLKSIYSPFCKLRKRVERGTKANMSKGRSSRANLKCAKKR
jgi:hypothetical protein